MIRSKFAKRRKRFISRVKHHELNRTCIGHLLRRNFVLFPVVYVFVNHAGEDKTVILTQTCKDRRVRIEVIDHGEGIPADKLPYIWDRYYKVDKEHRRGVIGSGLGLSIVKSILDAHNARFGVRSTPGKGSVFWFELETVSVKKRKNKGRAESASPGT